MYRYTVEYMPLDDDPAGLLLALGMTVRRSMGGTSGALYDIFFSTAAAAVKSRSSMADENVASTWWGCTS